MVFKENTGQKINMIHLIFIPISKKINSAEIEGHWKFFFIILEKQTFRKKKFRHLNIENFIEN